MVRRAIKDYLKPLKSKMLTPAPEDAARLVKAPEVDELRMIHMFLMDTLTSKVDIITWRWVV